MPARLELSYSPAIDLKKDITYGPSNRLRGVPARRLHAISLWFERRP